MSLPPSEAGAGGRGQAPPAPADRASHAGRTSAGGGKRRTRSPVRREDATLLFGVGEGDEGPCASEPTNGLATGTDFPKSEAEYQEGPWVGLDARGGPTPATAMTGNSAVEEGQGDGGSAGSGGDDHPGLGLGDDDGTRLQSGGFGGLPVGVAPAATGDPSPRKRARGGGVGGAGAGATAAPPASSRATAAAANRARVGASAPRGEGRGDKEVDASVGGAAEPKQPRAGQIPVGWSMGIGPTAVPSGGPTGSLGGGASHAPRGYLWSLQPMLGSGVDAAAAQGAAGAGATTGPGAAAGGSSSLLQRHAGGGGAPASTGGAGGSGGAPAPNVLVVPNLRGAGKRDAACATMFLSQLREEHDPVSGLGGWTLCWHCDFFSPPPPSLSRLCRIWLALQGIACVRG